MALAEQSELSLYRVGWGRRIALLGIFALLLPFFMSMPVMIGMRATYGFIWDAAILAVAAVLYAICLTFIILQIQASQKTKFEFTDNALNLVVPNWRGLTPTGPFEEATIPYDQIESVEERGEIYKVAGLMGMPRATCVVTKDGRRYVLGYVNEFEEDPAIHYGEVAKLLAERANLGVSYKGVVDSGSQYHALRNGTPPWDCEALPENEVAAARARTHRAGRFFLFGFFGLVALATALLLVPELTSFLAELAAKKAR